MGRPYCLYTYIYLFSTHESFGRDDIVWAGQGLVSKSMNIWVNDLLSVVVVVIIQLSYFYYIFLTLKRKECLFWVIGAFETWIYVNFS